MSAPRYFLAVLSDGSVEHYEMQTRMRAPRLPERGGWQGPDPLGWFYREPTVANAEDDLSRHAELRAPLTVVSVRELSDDERAVFSSNRPYRNALRHVSGTVQHDMPAARECHRNILRHQAGEKLLLVEREHVRATIAKDPQALKVAEDEHTRLTNIAADPRIEAAQTLDALKVITV